MKSFIIPFLTKLVFLLVTFSFVTCEKGAGQDKSPIPQGQEADSLFHFKELKTEKTESSPLILTYRLDSLTDVKKADSLWASYTAGEQKMILALNRIESVRVGPGSRVVVPESLLANFNMYAPFPAELELLNPISKTVLICRRTQAFALYECGRLIRWGPVSTGKESTPTPAGLSYGNYKAKRKVSTVNQSWIMPYYFNFMNFEGVGVHQYLLPGFPASHACVRLDLADAMFIYDWAEQWELDPKGQKVVKNGTPFMVFGDYNFEAEVPWLQLVKDPAANDLSNEELKILEDYVQEYFKDERNFIKSQTIEPPVIIAT